MSDVILVEGLTKIYRANRHGTTVRAVEGIDFSVHAGEVFGFLGPNGAGKTTTIRMLTGLTRPTSGKARVLTFDPSTEAARVKKQIGVVPENSNLYDELSAVDNLIFSMQLYGVPRAERVRRAETLLERFGLRGKRDVPFAHLSRGMKRALTVAAALAHQPPLIFLDEPTTGLDVSSARNLRQMIAGLRQEGVTVFLTTHYLEEAERLCDRVAILVEGNIVALDTVEGLKASARKKTSVEVTLRDTQDGVITRRATGDDVRKLILQLLGQVGDRQVVAVQTLQPSLEDVFVKLTGLSAEVMVAENGRRGGRHAGG